MTCPAGSPQGGTPRTCQGRRFRGKATAAGPAGFTDRKGQPMPPPTTPEEHGGLLPQTSPKCGGQARAACSPNTATPRPLLSLPMVSRNSASLPKPDPTYCMTTRWTRPPKPFPTHGIQERRIPPNQTPLSAYRPGAPLLESAPQPWQRGTARPSSNRFPTMASRHGAPHSHGAPHPPNPPIGPFPPWVWRGAALPFPVTPLPAMMPSEPGALCRPGLRGWGCCGRLGASWPLSAVGQKGR